MITIKKPHFDNREFKGITLANNIKCIFVNDAMLDKSYVTVSINIGSFANPKEYLGMAHFLEHMLFMGSMKYPDENHYNARLNESGGYSNAYTSETKTVYYFSVFDSNLEEIIDIFSRFFIDPLFKEDSILREMNAVDSEHKKNINSDMWRNYNIMYTISDENSNTNGFSTGNLKTLNKPNIRENMIEFYKKYYVPENMSICIISSKSINNMKDMIDRTFGNIKMTPKETFIMTKPFYTENRGKVFFQKTLSDIYIVDYIYEIPVQYNSMTYEFGILRDIFMNKSKNSLYFNLINLGLIVSMFIDIDDIGLFKITLKLTSNGYDKIQQIHTIILSYIKMIINLNIVDYAKYYQKIYEIKWKYMEKMDAMELCSILANKHHYLDTINVFFQDFNIMKIMPNNMYIDIFNKYINKDNMIILIQAKEDYIKHDINLKYIVDEFYGTHYMMIDNKYFCSGKNKKLDFKWGSTDIIKIDSTNIYKLDKNMVPTIISDNIWYGACSIFGEPVVNVSFQFNNNKYYDTPRSYLLTKISCSIMNVLIGTILYKPLELPFNIYFSAYHPVSTINININGLNDINILHMLVQKIFVFLENIIEHFSKLNNDYITNLISNYKKDFINIINKNPAEYSQYIINKMIYKTTYDYDVLLKELELIGRCKIEKHLKELFIDSSLKIIIYGNIKKPLKLLKSKQFIEKSTLLYNKEEEFISLNKIENVTINHPNIIEKSNCVNFFYYIGNLKEQYENIILVLLVIDILADEFFNDLRTKNQLGYLVKMFYTEYRNEYYIVQTIQSDKPVDFVKDKISEFNSMISNIIKKAKLNVFIETLKSKLLKPDYNMDEKYHKYLAEISSREYMFNRNEILAKELKNINLNKMINFTEKYINKDNMKHVIVKGN